VRHALTGPQSKEQRHVYQIVTAQVDGVLGELIV
jgi:hypothetical protein